MVADERREEETADEEGVEASADEVDDDDASLTESVVEVEESDESVVVEAATKASGGDTSSTSPSPAAGNPCSSSCCERDCDGDCKDEKEQSSHELESSGSTRVPWLNTPPDNMDALRAASIRRSLGEERVEKWTVCNLRDTHRGGKVKWRGGKGCNPGRKGEKKGGGKG